MTVDEFRQINNFEFKMTFPSGWDRTNVMDLGGMTPVGLRTPDDTNLTSITFETSDKEDQGFLPLVDTSNSSISITVDGTAAQHALDPTDMAGCQFIRLVGDANANTPQEFILVCRPV